MDDRSSDTKRDRMSQIRADRRNAGFTEVNVWLPQEYAKTFRDLAWHVVDLSKRSFPSRRPVSEEEADLGELAGFLERFGLRKVTNRTDKTAGGRS